MSYTTYTIHTSPTNSSISKPSPRIRSYDGFGCMVLPLEGSFTEPFPDWLGFQALNLWRWHVWPQVWRFLVANATTSTNMAACGTTRFRMKFLVKKQQFLNVAKIHAKFRLKPFVKPSFFTSEKNALPNLQANFRGNLRVCFLIGHDLLPQHSHLFLCLLPDI